MKEIIWIHKEIFLLKRIDNNAIGRLEGTSGLIDFKDWSFLNINFNDISKGLDYADLINKKDYWEKLSQCEIKSFIQAWKKLFRNEKYKDVYEKIIQMKKETINVKTNCEVLFGE